MRIEDVDVGRILGGSGGDASQEQGADASQKLHLVELIAPLLRKRRVVVVLRWIVVELCSQGS